MAVGTPVLATPNVGASAASVATASFSPSAGDLLIAKVSGRGVAAEEPTISDDLGTTWTELPGSSLQNGVIRMRIWYQIASGGARVVTGASVSATQIGVEVIAIPGGAVELGNVEFATSTSGDPSITMAAYGGSSICVAGAISSGGGAANFTQPSGFTELHDISIATNLRAHFCYDMASPGTALVWSSTGGDSIGYGIEIIEGTLDKTITGALFTDTDTFFASTLTLRVAGALFTDADTFFGATVAQTQNITGALFTDADTFHGATVTSVYTVTGALFTDADTFFAATVVGGAQTITGALFSDADTFFAATLQSDNTITGALYTDTDTFFGGVINSVYPITGALYSDTDTFFASNVSHITAQTITGARFDDADTFGGAIVSVAVNAVIQANFFIDPDDWFNNEVQMTLPEVPQDPAEEPLSEFDPERPPYGPQPPMFFTTMIDTPDEGRRRR